MRTPHWRGFHLKERVVTKTRKFRLVRLGDAKRLTQGEGFINYEVNTLPGEEPRG
jgi:hypothetical protein